MRPALNSLGRAELAGLVLIVGWIGWAVTAAGLAGYVLPPTSPYVTAPLALAIGVSLGRLAARHADSAAVAWALVVLASILLIGVLATSGPAKNPLGYANANAALAVQLIGLCGLALLRAERTRRILLALAAVGAAAVVLANRSIAGLAMTLPLMAVVVAMAWRPARARSWRVLAVLTAVGVTTGAAISVALLAERAEWPAWVLRTLEPARHSLWSDALALWRQHPVVGAGPGTFEQVSALGHDPDTAAAHSSVLQVGAEAGWVGVVLFGLLILGGLLWAARGAPAYAVVAAATWTALLVQSFVDHLLDFPAVVLTAGIVIGWAGSSRSSEELDVAEGQGPGRR